MTLQDFRVWVEAEQGDGMLWVFDEGRRNRVAEMERQVRDSLVADLTSTYWRLWEASTDDRDAYPDRPGSLLQTAHTVALRPLKDAWEARRDAERWRRLMDQGVGAHPKAPCLAQDLKALLQDCSAEQVVTWVKTIVAEAAMPPEGTA